MMNIGNVIMTKRKELGLTQQALVLTSRNFSTQM